MTLDDFKGKVKSLFHEKDISISFKKVEDISELSVCVDGVKYGGRFQCTGDKRKDDWQEECLFVKGIDMLSTIDNKRV